MVCNLSEAIYWNKCKLFSFHIHLYFILRFCPKDNVSTLCNLKIIFSFINNAGSYMDDVTQLLQFNVIHQKSSSWQIAISFPVLPCFLYLHLLSCHIPVYSTRDELYSPSPIDIWLSYVIYLANRMLVAVTVYPICSDARP